MTKIAEILGLDAAAAEPMVAVVRCNGTCANRPRVNQYDGAKSCAIAASLYGVNRVVVMAVWDAATVWLPASSMLST